MDPKEHNENVFNLTGAIYMKPVKGVFKKDKAAYKISDFILAAVITGLLVYWSHM